MDMSVPMFWRMKKDKYNLIASKCLDCNNLSIPTKQSCLECGSKNMINQNLSGKGKVYSYTIIRASPKGFDAPYIVAMIKLEEGLMIVGEIVDIDIEEVTKQNLINKGVSQVFRKITETRDSLRVYGIKFLLE